MRSLLSYLPQRYERYIEPFAGGAALFFALSPTSAILGDTNDDLMTAYRVVASDPETVIHALSLMANSADKYYEVRNERPKSDLDRAVRMLYLTRLAFNGIFRVNLRGEFNVPYGGRSCMPTCDGQHLRQCAVALRRAKLITASYSETLSMAGEGDLVYADPPYTVAHNNNGFLRYNERIFSWEDQRELAQCLSDAADRGAQVIVSNADHKDLHEIYSGFRRVTVKRYTGVSATPSGRRVVTECLYLRSRH